MSRYVPNLADVTRLHSGKRHPFVHMRTFPVAATDVTFNEIAPGPADRTSTVPSGKFEELEAELTRLREMIAAVVTKQEAGVYGNVPPCPPVFPGGAMARAGPPFLCGGPPPPPPPPPSMASLLPRVINVADMIKQNRTGQKVIGSSNARPSMADVLSGLGSVQLKTVERSPGGTPMRPKGDTSAPALLMDPAAMIAQVASAVTLINLHPLLLLHSFLSSVFFSHQRNSCMSDVTERVFLKAVGL